MSRSAFWLTALWIHYRKTTHGTTHKRDQNNNDNSNHNNNHIYNYNRLLLVYLVFFCDSESRCDSKRRKLFWIMGNVWRFCHYGSPVESGGGFAAAGAAGIPPSSRSSSGSNDYEPNSTSTTIHATAAFAIASTVA